MANTGFKGCDIRQTGNQLVFRALLQDSTGALLTTGTTTFRLYELQSDGTLKSYDFNDNTFKTTALTTATLAATHRTGNNSTANTGVWTAILATLTGFTIGGQYFVTVNNTGASPTDQVREFLYGSAEGDLVVTAITTGTGAVTSNLGMILGTILTETSGLIAAGVKKFFNVATPTGTVNSLPDAVAGAASGLAIVGSNVGAATSVSGAVGSVTAGVTVTTNNDKTGYGLSGTAVQAIWDALTSALTTAGSIGKRISDYLTGDAYVRLGTPAGASIAADIATKPTAAQVAAVILATPANLLVTDSIGRVTTTFGLHKNTALANFEFPMVSSVDNVTPLAGLTVAGTVSIDGGAFVALTNAISGVASGIYKVNLAAADLNGTNIILRFTATGAATTLVCLVMQN